MFEILAKREQTTSLVLKNRAQISLRFCGSFIKINNHLADIKFP